MTVLNDYRVCVIGGWCGNRMLMVAERFTQLFEQTGLACKVSHHSVWDNYSAPPAANLVLQLLPAFTEAETGCPVINIKPMLVDLDDPDTLDRVLQQVRADLPA